jgi:hypothetical protein
MNAWPLVQGSHRMQHARPCSFCGEADHVEWRCPELVAPIRDQGMMKPPPGQPMGGDDDALKNLNPMSPASMTQDDSTKTLESKWTVQSASEKLQRRRVVPS